MPFADRGTHRLSYEALGRDYAPSLLLVMGMGFSSRAWGPLPARLARAFRVVVFDNRGTGGSTAPPGGFSIADLADDAAAVLDAARAAPAAVFGVSMGGMIALELALRHPEAVSALALGATLAGWRGSAKAGPLAMGELLAGSLLSRAGAHRLVGRALVSAATLRDDYARFAAWMENVGRGAPALVARQALAVTRHDVRSRLGALQVPTLVLTGDADRVVPAENSRRLAEAIPGARLVVFPGAGHGFPFERLEETAAALETFFGAAGRRSARGRAE